MTNRFARLGLRAMVWCALAGAAEAQPTTTRVSVSSSGAQANGPCFVSSISVDGRFVLFDSEADNLVDGDTNGVQDVFVHDRQTGHTTRVSVASDGTPGNLISGSHGGETTISADGRFVVFESNATNLLGPGGDTNGATDIFVHDRDWDGGSAMPNGVFDEPGVGTRTFRVSVSSSGTQANGQSNNPSISADGRFVVFWGDASNLVPEDTNEVADTFVHDRQTGLTTRVSVASPPNATQGNCHSGIATISGDGRFVAFQSRASNLVSEDTNGPPECTPLQITFDIGTDNFVHDRQTGQTTRVSIASNGAQGDSQSSSPRITSSGRFVVFNSFAKLVPEDTNLKSDGYLHDRQTGETTRISVSFDGTPENADSYGKDISDDGRLVAITSYASNLVPGDTNSFVDVFIHDRRSSQTRRVSVATEGTQGNEESGLIGGFYLSEDGRFVTFNSRATNFVPGDTNGTWDVFVRDALPLFILDGDELAAAVVANFDGDVEGLPDIAVADAGASTVTLRLNNGVPEEPISFAEPMPSLVFQVGLQPRAMASADIDGVTGPDLAVANGVSGTVSILLNNGSGSFAPAPEVLAPGSPRGVTLADLDHDGLLDLIVARRDADAVSIFRNLGGGNFGLDQPQNVPPGGRPSGVGSGDLDNDKDIDVVVPTSEANMIVVFPNASPGMGAIAFGPTLTFPVGAGSPRPAAVVVAHLDGDQFLDVAVANKDTNTVAVLRNKGVDGGGAWLGFEAPVEFTVGSLPVSIGAGEDAAMGDRYLFTANAFTNGMNQSSVSRLKNVSSPGVIAFEPEFRIAAPSYAAFITGADLNLDNRLDLPLASGFDAAVNTDAPANAPVNTSAPSGAPRGALVGAAVVFAGATPSGTLAPCAGDANGDRIVDFLDLNIVLSFYGQSGPALPGDLDADEDVDFVDLNIVLSAFGAAC